MEMATSEESKTLEMEAPDGIYTVTVLEDT
jgi:hypothetical protein